MERKSSPYIDFLLLCVLVFLITLFSVWLAEQTAPKAAAAQIPAPAPVVIVEVIPRFSHRQEVWMYALEWCESGGDNTAINPLDLDGTASYYALQFKPATFRDLGERYGVIEKGKTDAEMMELLKVYALQRAILEFMVEDPGTRWESQFPGCVRKLGRPPLT